MTANKDINRQIALRDIGIQVGRHVAVILGMCLAIVFSGGFAIM